MRNSRGGGGEFTKTITSGTGNGFVMRAVGASTEVAIIRVQITLA